ncbi:MAG: iron-containing alcohol dehydrogenase [Pseudomonadota bacterium]
MVRVCMPRILDIGAGALGRLPAALATIGAAAKPLIVTDQFMTSSGLTDRVSGLIAEAGLTSAVFDQITPDPTDEQVKLGIAKLEAGEHDCVIGLGGGSPIDAAKAIAVMATGSREITDYRPPKQTDTGGLPLVAIPTTAGTGSEVTHHTVIIHDATREKISCRGEAFVPVAAIVDYELTLSKPRRLIADNGLDTLTHAIEAYVSRKASLFSDRMALDCMRLVAGNLEAAYADPENRPAREALMLAATLGGLAFSNASIALVHAMSRPLGSLFHIPHGMSNAMLLPTVTAYSKSAAIKRYAECARIIGAGSEADSDQAAADKLVEALYRFNERLQVPSLSGFGVDKTRYHDAVARMAEDAVRSGAPANNPRSGNVGEISELYHAAWG